MCVVKDCVCMAAVLFGMQCLFLCQIKSVCICMAARMGLVDSASSEATVLMNNAGIEASHEVFKSPLLFNLEVR